MKNHRQQCRGAHSFTCIDCGKTLSGAELDAHTSCITEAEKYQGKLYQPKKEKKKQKQNQNQAKIDQQPNPIQSESNEANSSLETQIQPTANKKRKSENGETKPSKKQQNDSNKVQEEPIVVVAANETISDDGTYLQYQKKLKFKKKAKKVLKKVRGS